MYNNRVKFSQTTSNLLFIVSIFISQSLFNSLHAQQDRWQQHIRYDMDVNMDVNTNTFSGIEKIVYDNNSPDTLNKIFFHLYWNAFQPNSSMDIRSRELGKIISTDKNGREYADWDPRVKDRISKLNDNEIGYQKVKYVRINGKHQPLIVHETILEVQLLQKIQPHTSTNIEVAFEAQVPIQIRRSGRNNAEGVQYSMSQWYPKMVEYDYQGWNANPYIAREFYGVWGDYTVNITIDKNYMIAGTGVLQNPNQIGFGYENPNSKVINNKTEKLTWKFYGQNIHDFVWAADTAYKHISRRVRPGLILHAFYKSGSTKVDSVWNNLLWSAEAVLPFIENKFGKYPYPQYSFIQGGDGGMEYAMATLIKGPSLGTVFHEWMHSWYQHLLGTNESLFAWMDEGFTEYASNYVSEYYYSKCVAKSPFLAEKDKPGFIQSAERFKKLPLRHSGNYNSYFELVKSGLEEPLSTHADHFNTNFAYGNASYGKGAVFLAQLGYIIGEANLENTLITYYNQWSYKHPNANDFIRVAEMQSGVALQWYKEYWVNSVKSIDYAIGNIDLNTQNGHTVIHLQRIGKMPMPVDVLLTYKDGKKEIHSIPLDIMFAHKSQEDSIKFIVEKEWQWVSPNYSFEIEKDIKELKSIEIDPSFRMADINRSNNKLIIPD